MYIYLSLNISLWGGGGKHEGQEVVPACLGAEVVPPSLAAGAGGAGGAGGSGRITSRGARRSQGKGSGSKGIARSSGKDAVCKGETGGNFQP